MKACSFPKYFLKKAEFWKSLTLPGKLHAFKMSVIEFLPNSYTQSWNFY